MSFVCTNLDSQVLVDVVDAAWAADKLPFEDIHVPLQELPDSEPDSTTANLSLRQLESRWTDLMLTSHQKVPLSLPREQPLVDPKDTLTPLTHFLKMMPSVIAMELPELGKQCMLAQCKQLDFLPFKCSHCLLVFCKDHSSPLLHHCNNIPTASEGTDASNFKFKCTVAKCHNKELVAVNCDKCGLNFCLQHRHSSDHRCVPDDEKESPEEKLARQKVNSIAQSLGQKPKPRGGKKDPKLAAKVQLMKLKMKAVPVGPTLPPELRLHLLVCLPLKHPHAKAIAVSVDATWSVGRALDAICTKAKVPNHNSTSASSALQLFRLCDGSLLLPSSKLKELVSAEELCDGDTVVLEETSRGTHQLEDTSAYQPKL